ncbi:MAG TPA: hypothetical protein VK623_04895 [Flavobacterium sp.]|nr:hypothetical protein [Flavobacterium sp.]
MKNTIALFSLLLLYSCNAIKNEAAFSSQACENIELDNNRIFINPQIGAKKKSLLDFNKTSAVCFRKKTGCHLDFDNQQLCSLSEKKLQEFLNSSDYKEIESKFRGQSFSFSILIKRKEYEFLFDPGFAGSFRMPYKASIPFLKEAHQNIESQSSIAFVYNNKSISFNGIYYSSAITISNAVKQQSVGMGFIKGFNWLIDTNNKKVYVKKNALSLDIFQKRPLSAIFRSIRNDKQISFTEK